MTKTTDTHLLAIAGYHADQATRYLNRVGSFWHAVHQGDYSKSNPSKASKHHAYGSAATIVQILGIDRHHSTLLDIIATVDAAHDAGLGKVKLTDRARTEIIATVTPRS